MSDNQPSSHQEEQRAAIQEGDSASVDPESSAGLNTEEETDAEKRDKTEAEEQETQGAESDGEEGKGVKRKREEVHREDEVGQTSEKKKVKTHKFHINTIIKGTGNLI